MSKKYNVIVSKSIILFNYLPLYDVVNNVLE